MNNKKKIVLLLAFFSLFICVYETSKTYAKYFTVKTVNTDTKVKKWHLKINNIDIENNTDLTKYLTLSTTKNPHVADNHIAPSSEGFLEINVDYKDVEVPFEIALKINSTNGVKDVKIYKTTIDGVEVTPSPQVPDKIISHVDINDPNDKDKVKNIKVYIKWIDDNTNNNTMTDIEDTEAIKLNDLTFKTNISFTQTVR